MATILFVSVRQTFDPRMRINDLEPWVSRAWAISVAKASTADRVVALVEGRAIAAWDLRGAFPAEETYTVATGDTRPRVALALGSPLPVLAEYDQPDLNMRRGVAVVVVDTPPLPPEREWLGISDPVAPTPASLHS